MVDDKVADFLQTGQSGDVTFMAGNNIIPTADARAAEHGPVSQTLHVVSYIIVGRPPPLREVPPERTSHGRRNYQCRKDRVCLCQNGRWPR